jgi:hypothetical protein
MMWTESHKDFRVPCHAASGLEEDRAVFPEGEMVSSRVPDEFIDEAVREKHGACL